MQRRGGQARTSTAGKQRRGTPVVRSVERAMRILDALYRAPQGNSIADLSEELNLPKKTIRRLLHTLLALRVVEAGENGEGYHRNPSLWLDIACDLPGFHLTSDTVQTVLSDLEQETGLTANLGTPDHELRSMALTDWYIRRRALGFKPRHRGPTPMHATAVGLAYLAGLSPRDLSELMPVRLPQLTVSTIDSRKRLKDELALVRQRGYAVCRGTLWADSAAVATPVLDAKGRTIAAISLGGPTELLTEALVQLSLPAMRKASERLSRLAFAAPAGEAAADARREPETQPSERTVEAVPAGATSAARRGVRRGKPLPIVRAVERAVRIIHTLWHSHEARSLTQLSTELSIHKTTVLRILRTLVAVGVVYRDEEADLYTCSPFCWLAARHGPSSAKLLTRTVRTIMEEMADAANMLVWLATPDPRVRATTVAALAIPESWAQPQPSRRQASSLHAMVRRKVPLLTAFPAELNKMLEVMERVRRGERFNATERRGDPMHATAAGKIHLASLPQAELLAWIPSELPRITKHTITSRKAFLEELAEVRRQGYAVSREEAVPGVFTLGVRVRGAKRRTIASLGVAVPSRRMSDALITRCVRILRAGADEIGEMLHATRLGGREEAVWPG